MHSRLLSEREVDSAAKRTSARGPLVHCPRKVGGIDCDGGVFDARASTSICRSKPAIVSLARPRFLVLRVGIDWRDQSTCVCTPSLLSRSGAKTHHFRCRGLWLVRLARLTPTTWSLPRELRPEVVEGEGACEGADNSVLVLL